MGYGQSDAEREFYVFRNVDTLGARAQPRVRRAAQAMAGVDGRPALQHRQKRGRRRDDGNNDGRCHQRALGPLVVVKTQTGHIPRPVQERQRLDYAVRTTTDCHVAVRFAGRFR